MITKNMVKSGYKKGLIKLDKSPNNDGVVCRIKKYWFYFGGEKAANLTVSQYKKENSEENIISEIFRGLNEICSEIPDEYVYCLNVLTENAI